MLKELIVNTVLFRSLVAVGVVMACASAASAAAPSHQYRLNASYSDDLGGTALVDHGGVLDGSGYTFGQNQGLTMAVDLGAVYTVDLGYRFDSHNGWQKIIDFSNLALDSGMYTYGSDYNFYPAGNYIAAPADGVDGRLTLTRDASSLVSIYSNGTFAGSFSDTSGLADFTGKDAHFFIDDFATGQVEAGRGHVDYIRTWNTALTANEIGVLGVPVAAVPEPETYALLLAGLGIVSAVARRRKAKQA